MSQQSNRFLMEIDVEVNEKQILINITYEGM